MLSAAAHAASPAEPSPVLELRRKPMIEVVSIGLNNRGRLRIATLVTSAEIRRVDFLLDGELVGSDHKFPFGTVIEAPPETGVNRVEAVAMDGSGQELARDELVLHPEDSTLSVSVSNVRKLAEAGWLEIEAEVRHPPDNGVERVDFYRDDRYVASASNFPYQARFPSSAEDSYVRAVALTRTGALAEGVHLLNALGQTDSVSVRLVELYAMVTNRAGEPVIGLGRESFELLQGDEPRPIERFSEGDSVPLSLALVVDGSGSMHRSMERAKQSAEEFLHNVLDEGDEALLVDFDIRPRLLQGHTEDIETLISRFDEIRARGGSAVYDAILFGSLQLEGRRGRKALVVLTDGLDSDSRITTVECAHLARRAGVPIFALSLRDGTETLPSHRGLALRRLTQTTGGSTHEIRTPEDIGAAYRSIELQLRGQYLLGFSASRALTSDDLDRLAIRVADERLKVRTILGGQVRVMN